METCDLYGLQDGRHHDTTVVRSFHCELRDEGHIARSNNRKGHERSWLYTRTGNRHDHSRNGDEYYHRPERCRQVDIHQSLRRRCSDLQAQLKLARAELELERQHKRSIGLGNDQLSDVGCISTFGALNKCVHNVALELRRSVGHPDALAVPLHAASISALLARGRVPQVLHPLLSLAAAAETVRPCDIIVPLCQAATHAVLYSKIFAPFLPGFPPIDSPLDTLFALVSSHESREQAENWCATTYRAAVSVRDTNGLTAHLTTVLSALLAELMTAILPAGTCTIPSDLESHAQSLVSAALLWQDAAASAPEAHKFEIFLPVPRTPVVDDAMQLIEDQSETRKAEDQADGANNRKIILMATSPGLRVRRGGTVVIKAQVLAV